MAGVKIVDLPALGRDLINTDLLEVSLNGGGSRKITGQEIMNASKLAIGSTPIVSGTVGRLLFQGTGDVLQQSSSLFWDNTNGYFGIGTSSPTAPLTIKFTGQTGQDFYISGSGSNTHNIGGGNTLNIVHPNITAGASFGTAYGSVNRYFSIGSSFNLNARLAVLGGGTTSATSSFLVLNNSSTELFRIRDNGNVGINTTTDAGFRLDVNGTARVGTLRLNSVGDTIEFNNTLVRIRRSSNRMNFEAFDGFDFTDTNISATRIRIFGTTGNVGINTTTDDGFRLDVNGTARVQGATTISSGTNSNIRLSGTSIEFSRTVDGAYNTYITKNGSTNSVGLTFAALNSGNFFFESTSRILSLFGSTLNVGINTTTDAGYKLDVNGTARVQGGFTIDSTTAPVFRGVNPLTGTTNATSGGLLLTNQTGVTAMGIAGTYGGAGSRLTLFNNYTDPTTSRIKINLGGVDTACFFADGSLQIGNGETTIASAILSASSTTRGFLPPRMTNAQRAAIASPAVGLIVYCTDATEGLYVYKSTGWTFMV